MKTLTFVLLLSTASICSAWEFPRNPDRFPSFGFNVTNTELDGSRFQISSPTTALTRNDKGSLSTFVHALGGDIRLPVSNQLTVTLSGDYIESESDFIRDSRVYSETDKIDGYRYGLSFRLYLSK